MKTKYFLYARKSSEDEERQIMSIEAQLAELREFAEQESLDIAEIFVESKSAKKPGREIFGEMMEQVKLSDCPVGLLSWHPDRLARNSVDGGQIIYCIDNGKLTSLRFPTFWFEPTPQGLFMLQVAFGQSKYYSDNLSENVRRGIRQKLRRGEWPTRAPLGYANNAKTRNIEPDETKKRIIARAFSEFAAGDHTLASLSNRLSFWGLVSANGKPLCKAVVQRMLSNPAYIGLIEHNGEIYEGSFDPIVSVSLFEAVQKVLKERSRPRKKKRGHDFPFVGIFACGECKAAITAQYAHGNGGTYAYYRCTKRLGKCTQRYLRDDLMAGQMKKQLQTIGITEEWAKAMLAKVDVWEKEESLSKQSFVQNYDEKIKAVEHKLDILVNAYLDEDIEKTMYVQKKEELLKTKKDLQEKKVNFGQKGNNWIEPLRQWIISANQAQKLGFSKDFDEMKIFARKNGTNHLMLDQKIKFQFKEPFDLIPKHKEICEASLAGNKASEHLLKSKKEKSCIWSE